MTYKGFGPATGGQQQQARGMQRTQWQQQATRVPTMQYRPLTSTTVSHGMLNSTHALAMPWQQQHFQFEANSTCLPQHVYERVHRDDLGPPCMAKPRLIPHQVSTPSGGGRREAEGRERAAVQSRLSWLLAHGVGP